MGSVKNPTIFRVHFLDIVPEPNPNYRLNPECPGGTCSGVSGFDKRIPDPISNPGATT
jgi:hypothetical protein